MWCRFRSPAGASPPWTRSGRPMTRSSTRRRDTRSASAACVSSSPGTTKRALAEVERCLDAGMTGVKLYNQYIHRRPGPGPAPQAGGRAEDPRPHACGISHRTEDVQSQPRISHGVHFARASERHPDTIMIHAHIGAAATGSAPSAPCATPPQPVLRHQRQQPGRRTDRVGRSRDGAQRVLFGSDGTMSGSVGKVLGARLTDADRDLVFQGNAARILAARAR